MRSLSVRVAAAMVGLVAVVSVVISVLTTAAISSYLTKQLDTKVAAAQGRAIGALTKGDGGQPPPDTPHGQDAGTVTVYRTSSGATGNVITSDGVLATASSRRSRTRRSPHSTTYPRAMRTAPSICLR